jgi:hypothetical protein
VGGGGEGGSKNTHTEKERNLFYFFFNWRNIGLTSKKLYCFSHNKW